MANGKRLKYMFAWRIEGEGRVGLARIHAVFPERGLEGIFVRYDTRGDSVQSDVFFYGDRKTLNGNFNGSGAVREDSIRTFVIKEGNSNLGSQDIYRIPIEELTLNPRREEMLGYALRGLIEENLVGTVEAQKQGVRLVPTGFPRDILWEGAPINALYHTANLQETLRDKYFTTTLPAGDFTGMRV